MLSKKVAIITDKVMKYSPEILTGLGISLMISSTILAVKATPKALQLLENTDAETKLDKVNVVWKCYIPAVLSGSLGAVCLISASRANYKRKVALTSAYILADKTLKEYREKAVELLGDKKEKEIRDAIAKDHMQKNSVSNREVILTEKGDTLCYDAISGRYFKSDIDKIKKAVNEINRNMLTEMYVSLNDFYYELGLSSTRLGSELGWNIEDGFTEIDFSSQLAEDGTPCIVVDYKVGPRYEYQKLM